MIKYPNGKAFEREVKQEKKRKKTSAEISLSSANRGMDFENDINLSLEYYRNKDVALIYKRPTPINIVKVDYSKGAKIVDAYFEEQSTTDYNGIYKGKYIDFEAKNTKSKTSIPLSNITKHQVEHLKKVKIHGGITFFLISFQSLDEVYLIDGDYVVDFYEHHDRNSIPYSDVKEKGILIEKGYTPRLKIIEAIDKAYFEK